MALVSAAAIMLAIVVGLGAGAGHSFGNGEAALQLGKAGHDRRERSCEGSWAGRGVGKELNAFQNAMYVSLKNQHRSQGMPNRRSGVYVVTNYRVHAVA